MVIDNLAGKNKVWFKYRCVDCNCLNLFETFERYLPYCHHLYCSLCSELTEHYREGRLPRNFGV